MHSFENFVWFHSYFSIYHFILWTRRLIYEGWKIKCFLNSWSKKLSALFNSSAARLPEGRDKQLPVFRPVTKATNRLPDVLEAKDYFIRIKPYFTYPGVQIPAGTRCVGFGFSFCCFSHMWSCHDKRTMQIKPARTLKIGDEPAG